MSNTGDPLGVDIHCTTGFPLRMRLAYGDENLGNAALRRLNADEGCLVSIGDDPNYGFNLAKKLNSTLDVPGDMAAIGARSAAELEKDPRLSRMSARVYMGEPQGGDSGGE
jgi:hypothetical protein